MKKIRFVLFVAAIVLSSTTAFSQDIKPGSGDIAIEVMFTPLGNSPIGLDYFKGRLFLSDDLVFRLGVSANIFSEKSEPENQNNPNVNDESKLSSSEFGLSPGIEKHFGDFERVSPYVGAEIAFLTKSAKVEYTDNEANETYELEGAWNGDGENRGYTSFGLNIITGVDYYFVKRMYLGAELGFGFATVSWKEVTSTMGSNTTTLLEKSNSTIIGFNVVSAIRLGYAF